MAAPTDVTDQRPDAPGEGTETDGKDWTFARRPFWLFSHLFALTVVVSFVFFGFWQLDRLGQRQERNDLISARIAEVATLVSAPDGGADGAELDYRRVEGQVQFLDGDFARITNRSQDGVAGEHVVAIAELSDGSAIAVNRGFVPLGTENAALDRLPTDTVTLSGWLRATVTRERFGATDDGTGSVLPRFDTERLAFRLGRDLPTVWVQQAPLDDALAVGLPTPVPLPPLDDGPHRSYAVQWFIFATLGVLFYGALVWRRASGSRAVQAVPQVPLDD